jgi:RNA polymerase sigma factor (sigma-70 family)
MPDVLAIPSKMTADKKRSITHIVNAYSRRLFGFIRKRVDSNEDAQDILQDVFVQFVGATEPIEQMTAWLFRVARNKITDSQRKKRPDEFFGDAESENGDLFLDADLVSSQNPETEFLRTLFWDTLNNALDELPQEQKYVFIRHELDQVPFKEISEETGTPVNTLISRKRYAVMHLRERLQTLKEELLNY